MLPTVARTALLLAVLLAATVAQQFQQLQPLQSSSQRELLLLVQDIQNQLQQQGFQGFQQDGLQVQLSQPVILERRVVSVDPPREQQVQPQLQAQRVAVPVQAVQAAQQARQRPAANSTGKPQFVDPGVGRWVLQSDPSCLPCICEAASGCDEAIGCDDRGFCGPFLLSKRYWTLAGKPLLKGDSVDRPAASSDCLRDSFCAAEAVRGYLDRFAQDCDGDRRVDCLDLARVHFQGPFNCRAPLQPPTDFSETFRRCWDASRQNSQNRRR
ncbi:uncharacterized protein LOC117639476 [Thrips palmi]|uniref:lysozyme n=1 Tax=Thrips palmi TaxID=161013 RepID=A0A6P8Y3Y6_THRPL|nr:uncharacterized protein LOC117639476 [Thrips palmi]